MRVIPRYNAQLSVSSLVLQLSKVSKIVKMVHHRIAHNGLPYEIRKIQISRGLAYLNIPKRFTDLLRIEEGDIVKVQLVSDTYAGNSLSLSKVPITGEKEDD